ncbi:MAG: hypothetical protein KKG60_04195 [Nanoarchaeota archaeon]|nr:hypothetical protein [Nanoarchaeota archaeon]
MKKATLLTLLGLGTFSLANILGCAGSKPKTVTVNDMIYANNMGHTAPIQLVRDFKQLKLERDQLENIFLGSYLDWYLSGEASKKDSLLMDKYHTLMVDVDSTLARKKRMLLKEWSDEYPGIKGLLEEN